LKMGVAVVLARQPVCPETSNGCLNPSFPQTVKSS
jgi:hypothetical protein